MIPLIIIFCHFVKMGQIAFLKYSYITGHRTLHGPMYKIPGYYAPYNNCIKDLSHSHLVVHRYIVILTVLGI